MIDDPWGVEVKDGGRRMTSDSLYVEAPCKQIFLRIQARKTIEATYLSLDVIPGFSESHLYIYILHLMSRRPCCFLRLDTLDQIGVSRNTRSLLKWMLDFVDFTKPMEFLSRPFETDPVNRCDIHLPPVMELYAMLRAGSMDFVGQKQVLLGSFRGSS